MNRFLLDEKLDPLAEVLNVLDYNGIQYRREKDGVRFVFFDSGCQWETVCRFAAGMVLIYGVYPLTTVNEAAALRRINRISAQLTRGSLFLLEGRIILRTSAELFDEYSAYEMITRALEYNASVMVRFWGELADCPHMN